MDIEAFRAVNRPEDYIVTRHGLKRMRERRICLDDVMSAIQNGEIIEEYPEDFPFPSCLILGKSVSGNPLHAVVSLEAGNVYLITAYFPDPDEWESDWKTRKEAL